jgi:hypothetical protein
VHLFFIVFALFGAILILRFNKIIFLHLPAFFWGVYIEFSNNICPLTHLENWFLNKAGKEEYSINFIEKYIVKIVYPPVLNPNIQFYLGSILILVNLAIYCYIISKKRTGG